MTSFIRSSILLVAVLIASATAARAQLQTFETISAYSGQATQQIQSGIALTETFTNILELSSITYRFVTPGTSNSSQDIAAYFVQWDTATNKPAASALWTPAGAGTVTVPPSSSWTTYNYATQGGTYLGYDVTFDVNTFTDPNATYAMVLVGQTNASGLSLMNINDSDPFAYGDNFKSRTGQNITTLSSMASASQGSLDIGGDWGFSQIVLTPYVPSTPEPRTAAAILAALFVMGLVGRQLHLRRGQGSFALAAI